MPVSKIDMAIVGSAFGCYCIPTDIINYFNWTLLAYSATDLKHSDWWDVRNALF